MQWTEVIEVLAGTEVEGSYSRKVSWDSPTLILTTRASIQPDREFEMRSPERDLAQSRLLAYLPYTELIQPDHRVRWRGDVYQIDGPPALWPYGTTRHTVLQIWRAQGG
ncbi:hypothetical protein [Streptomyces sp. NPDC002644]